MSGADRATRNLIHRTPTDLANQLGKLLAVIDRSPLSSIQFVECLKHQALLLSNERKHPPHPAVTTIRPSFGVRRPVAAFHVRIESGDRSPHSKGHAGSTNPLLTVNVSGYAPHIRILRLRSEVYSSGREVQRRGAGSRERGAGVGVGRNKRSAVPAIRVPASALQTGRTIDAESATSDWTCGTNPRRANGPEIRCVLCGYKAR